MNSIIKYVAVLAFALAALVLTNPQPSFAETTPEETQKIVVELNTEMPLLVAAERAHRIGRRFDSDAFERRVDASQDSFVGLLRQRGINFRLTHTPLVLAGGRKFSRPDRFSRVINAIGLEVAKNQIDLIRAMPEVKHVTIHEPVRLLLDNSIKYVRANDGAGNKTIFSQYGGSATRFDGSGQVIAILDTGIEFSHPAFDTRFDDANYLQRTGDPRPVRNAGQAYIEGTHHPKVAYFLTLTATTNVDDVGHGTHAATDAAGLKVRGPGLDRIPGNADDKVIEGVAPGALLMNYKICETVFTCVGTLNIVTALEDAVSPTDPLGNPKPVATVINMSFGGSVGDPNDANAVAASNAALAGAVPVASAGNRGAVVTATCPANRVPCENTIGSPSAGRRVISVAASNDPGASVNELDVLAQDSARYTLVGVSTGAQDDTGRPKAPEDRVMKAVIMGGAPDVTFPLGQHYVYAGFADTPDQVPDAVRGRICLTSRGSTVTAGGQGSGNFANKANECAAKGAVAVLVFNNVAGELEAATATASTIPVYGVSQANGEYLRDALGFESPLFNKDDKTTWATISRFPLRINLADPSTFSPATTSFSSRGPVDNFQYVKPDLTAPGESIYAATIPAGGLHPTARSTMSDPSRYISVSGTSFSGPTVAGAAALVRQALLHAYGHAPISAAALRTGAATSEQKAQNAAVPPSLVRAALTNTTTHLREADGETAVADSDRRAFLHETGTGLIHVAQAVDARAVLGTNDANGAGGPDDVHDPDFLPTYSFGRNGVINSGNPSQTGSVTVTLQNISGASGAGTYTLRLVDGGGTKGDVTRPIVGTPGFSVAVSPGSVSLGSAVGGKATFNVNVAVDGTATGLQLAGQDDTSATATEFLWWVVATGSNGEVLRMPFFYRAEDASAVAPPGPAAPFQFAVRDDSNPDQVNGTDKDGHYRVSWSYPGLPALQPCAFEVDEATTFTPVFQDDAEELLVLGSNSTWSGAAVWTTAQHPNTHTNSYSVVYIDNLNASLTLKNAISIAAGTKAQLVFDSFEDIESSFDFGYVEASANGEPFITLATYTGGFSGKRIVDLSGFSGQSVTLRFRFATDLLVSTPFHSGWFIDNIQIEVADWKTLATVSAATSHYDVVGRDSGTYHYRIRGKFGPECSDVGPYSNLRQITVDLSNQPPPVAPSSSFTSSPSPGRINEAMTFDGSTSHDNDEGECCVVQYLWMFGDGTSATTTSPTTTHTYSASGTYRVTLTVTDDEGQTATSEALIEVVDPLVPNERRTAGDGWIPTGSSDKARFAFEASKIDTNAPTGRLTYHDPNVVKVSSTGITSLTVIDNTATFSGTCTINKKSGFTFTVDVVDNGPGTSDTFKITLSNGYTASGTLGGGNIVVEE